MKDVKILKKVSKYKRSHHGDLKVVTRKAEIMAMVMKMSLSEIVEHIYNIESGD